MKLILPVSQSLTSADDCASFMEEIEFEENDMSNKVFSMPVSNFRLALNLLLSGLMFVLFFAAVAVAVFGIGLGHCYSSER